MNGKFDELLKVEIESRIQKVFGTTMGERLIINVITEADQCSKEYSLKGWVCPTTQYKGG